MRLFHRIALGLMAGLVSAISPNPAAAQAARGPNACAMFDADELKGANRQVGISFLSGTRRVTLMDMAHADSMPPAKATLLEVARYLASRVR